jgi:hypothetical protein
MLSEFRRMQRNAYISVAAAVVVLVADAILFHDHEGLMTAIGTATFFGSLGLFVILDERECRAHRGGHERSANPRPDR